MTKISFLLSLFCICFSYSIYSVIIPDDKDADSYLNFAKERPFQSVGHLETAFKGINHDSQFITHGRCSAVLVDRQTVITSFSCIKNLQKYKKIVFDTAHTFFMLGNDDNKLFGDHHLQIQKMIISEKSEFGIIHLNRPVSPSDYSPAVMYQGSNELLNEKKVVVAGFGRPGTYNNGEKSKFDYQKRAYEQILETGKDGQFYLKDSLELKLSGLPSMGDQGGGIYYQDNEKYYLIGLLDEIIDDESGRPKGKVVLFDDESRRWIEDNKKIETYTNYTLPNFKIPGSPVEKIYETMQIINSELIDMSSEDEALFNNSLEKNLALLNTALYLNMETLLKGNFIDFKSTGKIIDLILDSSKDISSEDGDIRMYPPFENYLTPNSLILDLKINSTLSYIKILGSIIAESQMIFENILNEESISDDSITETTKELIVKNLSTISFLKNIFDKLLTETNEEISNNEISNSDEEISDEEQFLNESVDNTFYRIWGKAVSLFKTGTSNSLEQVSLGNVLLNDRNYIYMISVDEVKKKFFNEEFMKDLIEQGPSEDFNYLYLKSLISTNLKYQIIDENHPENYRIGQLHRISDFKIGNQGGHLVVNGFLETTNLTLLSGKLYGYGRIINNGVVENWGGKVSPGGEDKLQNKIENYKKRKLNNYEVKNHQTSFNKLTIVQDYNQHGTKENPYSKKGGSLELKVTHKANDQLNVLGRATLDGELVIRPVYPLKKGDYWVILKGVNGVKGKFEKVISTDPQVTFDIRYNDDSVVVFVKDFDKTISKKKAKYQVNGKAL